MLETLPYELPEAAYEALADEGFFDVPPPTLTKLALAWDVGELHRQIEPVVVPTTLDGDDLVEETPDEFISGARRLVERAEAILSRAVVHARTRGMSWEAIGQELGVTRQTAHERFHTAEEKWLLDLDFPAVPSPRGSWLPIACTSPNLTAGALRDIRLSFGESAAAWREGESECPSKPKWDIAEGIAALSAHAARLAERPVHPVSQRVFWERKARLLAQIAKDRPADEQAQRVAMEAAQKLVLTPDPPMVDEW